MGNKIGKSDQQTKYITSIPNLYPFYLKIILHQILNEKSHISIIGDAMVIVVQNIVLLLCRIFVSTFEYLLVQMFTEPKRCYFSSWCFYLRDIKP